MVSTAPLIAPLYAKHRDMMHRMAASVLRRSGRESEARDVVHEVMLSLMESPPTAAVSNWEAWLARATRNKAIDHIRTARVRHDGGPLDPVSHDTGDDTDLAQDVANAVDEQTDAALVRQALTTLTEQERRVVWKVYGLGEKQRAVANELALTPGRVSQICRSGLAKLSTQMQKVRSDLR
jgi:RNA polymerase sigma factor (sigma-70 family)